MNETKNRTMAKPRVRLLVPCNTRSFSGKYSTTNGLVHSGRHRSSKGLNSRIKAITAMVDAGTIAMYGRAQAENLALLESFTNQTEECEFVFDATYPNRVATVRMA
jgi:hypothetical protein